MKNYFSPKALSLTLLSALCSRRQANPPRKSEGGNHQNRPHSGPCTHYDSTGNVCDTVQANKGLTYRGAGQLDTMSIFFFSVPRVDSTYVFEVICDNYKPATISFPVTKIGRREQRREIPTIYLERAPQMLNELTVTSTKIKFYNKGDTVVYNAEAFQLAEGSMLDALIAQLPGVELNSDGQIKVNGEFVESLLLNGKEFFDGNNNLMLENIGAYTVKNIDVYEGQSVKSKRMQDTTAPKVLTMDVRLKKEYNMGWLINAQGGYGTENRYMGKLFAFVVQLHIACYLHRQCQQPQRQPPAGQIGQLDTGEYAVVRIEEHHSRPDL